jgi:hypothetical protein
MRSASVLPALALLALPSTSGAVGIPGTFPRAIVIVGSGQGVHVTRFQVSVRSVASQVRVRVRVVASSADGTRHPVIAVGPCTAGPPSSPLCKPTKSARLTVGNTRIDVTRVFVVARPAPFPDALRVTLTGGGQAVPFLRERVGGGGGTGEVLLNGGTWRFQQGTAWGLVATPPAGTVLDSVKFNSRTYAWRATSISDGSVTTRIGYEAQTPRWTFTNVLRGGAPFAFRHTPSVPALEQRPAPRGLSFTADLDAHRLFTVRIPLPAWQRAPSASVMP